MTADRVTLAAGVVDDENLLAMDISDPPVLFARHVAALWSRVAGDEIAVATVSSYIQKSKPGGRYEDDPVPAPQYEGGRPYWLPEQESALIEWWNRRRGRIGDPRSAGDRDARGKRTP